MNYLEAIDLVYLNYCNFKKNESLRIHNKTDKNLIEALKKATYTVYKTDKDFNSIKSYLDVICKDKPSILDEIEDYAILKDLEAVALVYNITFEAKKCIYKGNFKKIEPKNNDLTDITSYGEYWTKDLDIYTEQKNGNYNLLLIDSNPDILSFFKYANKHLNITWITSDHGGLDDKEIFIF